MQVRRNTAVGRRARGFSAAEVATQTRRGGSLRSEGTVFPTTVAWGAECGGVKVRGAIAPRIWTGHIAAPSSEEKQPPPSCHVIRDKAPRCTADLPPQRCSPMPDLVCSLAATAEMNRDGSRAGTEGAVPARQPGESRVGWRPIRQRNCAAEIDTLACGRGREEASTLRFVT